MLIAINGKLVKEKDAKISVLDHGLLFGDGVFETLRTYHGKLFKFSEHYQRLKSSAKQIMLPLPVSQVRLREEISKTIRANNLKEARVRVTITRGIGPSGLSIACKKPTVIIIAQELRQVSFEKGAKLITYPLERNIPQVKSLSYLPSVMAYAYAKKKNCLEAILIDKNNYAREGSYSNLFIVKNNKVMTPKNRILKGITRSRVIELAKKAKIPMTERDITRAQLIDADEIFITFTTAGIVPVITIDNHHKQIGNVTKRLVQLYKKPV